MAIDGVARQDTSRGGATGEATGQVPALARSELRYLVLAAQREGNRLLNRRLAPLGITASQSEVLLVLSRFGQLTLKALGELIVCETGSPSRIVDTLVRRGLVERTASDRDRRAVRLSLTAAGQAMVPDLERIDREMDLLPDAVVPADELAGFVSVLRAYLKGSPSAEVLDRRFAADREPLAA